MIDRPREEVVEAMNEAEEEARTLREDIQTLRRDAQALVDSFGRATGEVTRSIETTTRQRPYVALGIAAGVGYVLGGGVPSVVTRTAVRAGLRALLSMAVGQAASTLFAQQDLAKE